MHPVDYATDFSDVTLPDAENQMSRRFLEIVTRWVPVAMSYYGDWPDRPDCGHFLGGVLWYGQETAMSMTALAAAASSKEFDARLAGRSSEEVLHIARRGLRYLCFTHDTGPADCVRPKKSLGRPEPAGTKWGERGSGFFRESQCGRTISGMVVTAALVRDLLTDEDREMLANIAADYLDRFGEMAPKSGVYNDTQLEENAWTALGLTSCLACIPSHPRSPEWWENAKLWMFRSATKPEDSFNESIFADGKTVADLCQRTYTILPDGTAENHGFVHPNYMAAALVLSGRTINLMRLFGHPAPPHIHWHLRDIYGILKAWCDDTGSPQPVQGMDWPYLAHMQYGFMHTVANVYLGEPDAALLERRTLDTIDRASAAHGGRMVAEETVKHCHGQQDPALMRERMCIHLADAYLAHRLNGPGAAPSEEAAFETRNRGVRVYPHAGTLLHRHERGITSLSWRNRAMMLPGTREGIRVIGPAGGTMLASVSVKGKAKNTRQVALRIREAPDRATVLLVQDIAEGSVRRFLFFATLPGGKCLTDERLAALEDVEVLRVEQGHLHVMNDGYFGDWPDGRGRRTIHWQGGSETFAGYPTDSPGEDVLQELSPTRWVNVDDRFGLVFQGSGRATYHNRHYFEVWNAIKDDLVLSLGEEATSFAAGAEIARLVALWCPEQGHKETAQQDLKILNTSPGLSAVRLDRFLCAANFGEAETELPLDLGISAGASLPAAWGISAVADADLKMRLRLAALEPAIVELP